MKFLPRVCGPSLFSHLPGTQFPVSMIHSDDNISHTKYLNTSYFLKILLKNSDRYGGTLAYI
jgi:hypothetical protein